MKVARSAIDVSMFWCRRLRRPPSTPYQFFIAAVNLARLWCLATGTLMTLSASTRVVKMGHSSSTSPLRRIERYRCSCGSTISAPTS